MLRSYGSETNYSLFYPNGVNHGFMVRPDEIYKIETRGDSLVLIIHKVLLWTKSKPLTELQKTYFKWNSLFKCLLSHFYYETILGIKESIKFKSQNYRPYKINLEVAYLKKWYNQIDVSKANFTSFNNCEVRKQANDLLNRTRKLTIHKHLATLKLLQTVKNIIEPEKIKMKIITPVITESIVTHLLQSVNKNNKFFNIYQLIVNEANLVTAWLEINNKFKILTRNGLNINNKHNTIANLPFNWFKKTSKLLIKKIYKYKLVRTMTIQKKKKGNYWKLFIANSYDKIIQKAFHRILNVIFEGYSEWEKTKKETFKTFYFRVTNYTKILKKKSEYWLQKYKIKTIFLVKSYGFRLRKSVHVAIQMIKNTWSPNWLASFDISNELKNLNKNIFITKLKEYIDDEKVIEQITKTLNTQMIDITPNTKNCISGITQTCILSPLLFNLYLHSLDKFVEKIIRNIIKTDRRKPNSEYKKMMKLYTSKIKRRLIKVKFKVKKKQRKLINDSQKMPIQIYYTRYADNYIFGFYMSKIQTKLVIKNIIRFLMNNLKLNITETILKHSINNKNPFLGFEIQMISSKKFSYFVDKKLQTYKIHKNIISKKGAHEYKKFLEMIEWLGRRAVANVINKKIFPKKYIVKKKELKKIIPEAIQQESWFFNKHKHNKKMKLTYNNRYKNHQYKIKKWINVCQDLINSREVAELAKIIGKNQTYRLNSIRKDITKLIKKLIEPKTEKAYILKLKSLQKNKTKILYSNSNKEISKFEIFFSNKQIINKFRKKNIINFKKIPSAITQKTNLTDYKIVNWYITIAKGLLLYYKCTKNLNILKRLVFWAFRHSLIATIATKHKKSVKWTINNFGFNTKIFIKTG